MVGQFGAFGKIPALGDFLRLNVSAGFVQPWDDWLQAGMLASREALAENWDDAYLSAPIWRFTLPSGVAGPAGMIGIVMASVDRVGRQYPLTLAAPIDAANAALSHFANTSVFEHLEQIALDMLDDHNTREVLTSALALVAPMPAASSDSVDMPYAGLFPIEHVLAGQALAPRVGARDVIWTTAMDQDNRLMLTRGLPEGREMRALFDLHSPVWGNEDMAELI
ncbi:type VI secretion system-associated protein TagF [Sulfitobacter sp.]|uniref:type VI secretion system-associated protein TagF n=1 Tax=Sulfitobacter sp. TaxID=1903071 RepID=UPI0035650D3A